MLRNISDESAGEYKCQVSGEGPLFNTETQSKRLRVAGKHIRDARGEGVLNKACFSIF